MFDRRFAAEACLPLVYVERLHAEYGDTPGDQGDDHNADNDGHAAAADG